MKYCIYCGCEVDINCNRCPYCNEDISDSSTDKFYHSNIKCLKCGSSNVDFQINKANRKSIAHEEILYTCKECGEKFTDKNRLGASFNNCPQIILGDVEKKVIKFICIIVIGICLFLIYKNNKLKKIEEAKNWNRISCDGLAIASSDQIQDFVKDDKKSATEQYLNKNFIFSGTIFSIHLDDDIPNISIQEVYTLPTYYLNFDEVEKARKYNVGDKITVCGTITDMGGLYSVIKVENVTIIE